MGIPEKGYPCDTFPRAELGRLPPAQLKRNAAALLRDVWQEKYPCPTVTECCDG